MAGSLKTGGIWLGNASDTMHGLIGVYRDGDSTSDTCGIFMKLCSSLKEFISNGSGIDENS